MDASRCLDSNSLRRSDSLGGGSLYFMLIVTSTGDRPPWTPEILFLCSSSIWLVVSDTSDIGKLRLMLVGSSVLPLISPFGRIGEPIIGHCTWLASSGNSWPALILNFLNPFIPPSPPCLVWSLLKLVSVMFFKPRKPPPLWVAGDSTPLTSMYSSSSDMTSELPFTMVMSWCVRW